MQLPSISASTRFTSDDRCGTLVPGVLPHVGPNPGPLASLTGLLDKVAINPQPLPPASKFADEFCGTVPRGPFPPVPPHVGGLLR